MDPKAQVVLGGMTGRGDVSASDFLKKLYAVSGIKAYFDATALHPYMPTVDQVKTTIQQFRNAMVSHGDAATPMWISELAWGSDPPDSQGINKGPAGQAQLLTKAYKMVLANRRAWNVQHLFWYLLRDPRRPGGLVQLLRQRGHPQSEPHPEARLQRLQGDRQRKGRAAADDHGGPGAGKHDQRRHADVPVHVERAGLDLPVQVRRQAARRVRLSLHAEGGRSPTRHHTFYVRAIDAPGNVSPLVSRAFNVKTH